MTGIQCMPGQAAFDAHRVNEPDHQHLLLSSPTFAGPLHSCPAPGEAHSKAQQQAAGLAKALEEVQARAREPGGAPQALVDRLGQQQAQAEVQVGAAAAKQPQLASRATDS